MELVAINSTDDQTAEARLNRVFAAQKQAYNKTPYPGLAERKRDLKSLRRQIQRYQDAIAEALYEDFGGRSPAESKLIDALGPVLMIYHALRNVRKWMKPNKRWTELLFASNTIKVTYQPKGVVGVIGPWNFPIYATIGPLVMALAAGNRVMIKNSEFTPRSTAVLKQMLGEIFPQDQVAVFGEEVTDPNTFTSLPYDHIVFTGSPAVGKIIMRTAAQNLTPVTLELGGKSPAIVSRSSSLDDAAKRIVHGKALNSGQICVAPDFALVPRESVTEFTASLKAQFRKLYPTTQGNEHYTSILNERHFNRITGLIDEARNKGAEVTVCGESGPGRQMPLHIVTGVNDDMKLMHEEIFGPVLPIVPYDTIEEAIKYIADRPRPLAEYIFGHDKSEREKILRQTHSGGVSINDWGWHAFNHDAPFGGVGNSGMGSYHGAEGFRELSHQKTVYKRHRFFPVGLFYPPYGTKIQDLVLKIFLGHADPEVRVKPGPTE